MKRLEMIMLMEISNHLWFLLSSSFCGLTYRGKSCVLKIVSSLLEYDLVHQSCNVYE